MPPTDEETLQRAMRVRHLMDDRLHTMTPQERDRLMQVHLAQARGPVRNATLLLEMTSMLLRARQTAQAREQGTNHESHT